MATHDPHNQKQTSKPKTPAELIAEAEARQADENRLERIKRSKAESWQRRKKTHARIYGTVGRAEYDDLAERAIAQGRFRQRRDGTLQANVFEQLVSEARAYNTQTFLPSKDIEVAIRSLYVQLRKIGTNINQIARQTNIFGQTAADKTQIKVLLRSLEASIETFTRKPWRKDDDA